MENRVDEENLCIYESARTAQHIRTTLISYIVIALYEQRVYKRLDCDDESTQCTLDRIGALMCESVRDSTIASIDVT